MAQINKALEIREYLKGSKVRGFCTHARTITICIITFFRNKVTALCLREFVISRPYVVVRSE